VNVECPYCGSLFKSISQYSVCPYCGGESFVRYDRYIDVDVGNSNNIVISEHELRKVAKLSLVIVLILVASLSVLYTWTEFIEKKNQVISTLEDNIMQLEYNLSDVENELFNLEEIVDEKQSTIELYQNGSRFEQHNPTYNEVIDFIKNDKTNEKEYTDEYTCLEFACETNNNAENLGIRCYIVEITFNEFAHAIIGFPTIDKGMIYIEPQSDEFVENLVIGNDYWTECVIPEEGYYYLDEPDDTIEKITLYW